MKKQLFLAALALVALASCTNDEFVGNNSPDTPKNEMEAISFGSFSKGITRADFVGADAANLLGNTFIVSGFKGDGTTMTDVFNNYYVTWTENSAGKTESNTSDWEYVGTEVKKPSTLTTGAFQSIKYWDYNTSQYDFAAFSTGKLAASNVVTTEPEGGLTDGQVLISAISKENTYTGPKYTLKGDVSALKECYISNMVTAYKDNGSGSDYQKEVLLTFRNLSSKVRIALYETIPGYSVKNVNFYSEDNSDVVATGTGTNQLKNTAVTLFTTGTTNADNFITSGTYTVTFPTIGSVNKDKSDYNMAHVSFVADANGAGTTKEFGNLNYTAEPENKEANGSYLGRTSNNPSFAGTAAPWYTNVLPNETGTVLELRINYTLVATDGSGEVINIHGAKAFIPAIYTTWKPNFAYTYLFKISDNTNGWTSPTITDPAGLYPITFDAVIIDSQENEQTTITTVATPSITTYQQGHIYTDGDANGNTYDASKGTIYVMAMDNDATPAKPKTDIGTKGYLYTITNVSGNTTAKDEANVMDALNIQTSEVSGVITGRNGLVLTRNSLYFANTIPGVDGIDLIEGTDYPQYSAVRFTPSSGTYAFCYEVSDAADTYIYTAEKYASKPTDFETAGIYYEDPDGTKDVTTAPAAFSTEKYYYKKYTNLNKVYAVKVINVK